ncbi:tubulin-specific chaperone cofactor E-like protein [Homarus americanus]|uniref:Tubulin-specific chaperone cofactor E-like protein-like n=1 Tax=Homarus americanus TaxID=6706 RepID=A0A8J5N4B2_HOMAM|nr:tubulin-specific chaperone cofactor E-like protein [Homarus americanus]XP_042214487.1 tubulin-specific chaperone cofactor E-like protein [Homarus americanus]XP_042214488.1 tubulin-specific chaperone cofactor E-like protein [Homarus americanus]XP_042214489.1 tubulin-specific chaperone cofactor E-like protein [Homarus americanus]KAG7173152.1 Tubulin-specific chaperone cofactor E-like protein-like [Homarus americanus]
MPSLPEAVDLKYGDECPDAQVTETACVALTLKRSGRQRLPSVLILSECDIEKAGDEEEVERKCEGVRELDLSRNKLKEWKEVFKILRHLPGLGFLNLSYNSFEAPITDPSDVVSLTNLTRLVLNGTSLPWKDIHILLENAPRVEELHLCKNGYKKVETTPKKYSTVSRVHFNNNPSTEWREIESLGQMFPFLEVLILAECPLSTLTGDGQYHENFPNLKYLSLNSTKICTWDSVDVVNMFPKLLELRLQQCPLYENYKDEERRQLTIARLWRIQRLNGGGLITPEERENAERAFIRYYMNEEIRPQRYDELVHHHGELDPLVEVSLQPEKEVHVTIRFGEVTIQKVISVYARVLDLKKELEPEFGLPPNKMRIFYHDKGVDYGVAYAPEELKINSKQLYTINVHSGDEFIVELKVKPGEVA